MLGNYHHKLIFMQDNAFIHTAHKVKDWFKENGIWTTNWPPYSLDLNPIEYVWYMLKKLVLKMFIEIMNYLRESKEDWANLEEALKVAWEALPNSLFESLIESMPWRIEACIAANGWHTKY